MGQGDIPLRYTQRLSGACVEPTKHTRVPLHAGKEAICSPQNQEHVLCESDQRIAKVKLAGALKVHLEKGGRRRRQVN